MTTQPAAPRGPAGARPAAALLPIYRGPLPQATHQHGSPIERLPVTVYEQPGDASRAVAREIAELVQSRAAAGRKTVLGLATGSTPVGVYDELIRLHREEGVSFRSVVTFNLDEYWPMDRGALQSYHRFMREHLFDHLDIPAESIHIPDGTLSRQDVFSACEKYEEAIRAAGGIDLQILGIGRTGHIGFNEPPSAADSRTRRVHLDAVTRRDNASFFARPEDVPHGAVTMGVATILEARQVELLAFGPAKAEIIRRALSESPHAACPATWLQLHPACTFHLDPAANAAL